ncbi:glycosyltransferase family 2 protein [Yoonia sp. GPGPB17]|uniref:glycosyltransferase family 2 protein n=1 Tax=Yoonia sp. GPGPB17 TaxID=3026147 RepID=UPI0030BCF3EF
MQQNHAGQTNTGRLQVSAFAISLNEAAKIENCLRSVADCAEIVLVDSGSTDDTIMIAQRLQKDGLPIQIFHQPWLGYAAQKQFALEKCTQPWCLSIDADERLDDELRSQLDELVNCTKSVVGWRIPRRGYLPGFGFTPNGVKERAKLRLIRNGKGAFDLTLDVHEKIIPDGMVKTVKKGSLLHFTPQMIDDQILKENKYSTLKADMIVRKDKSRNPWRLLISPPFYFFRLYVRHGLWRCGFPGYIQAATGAVYSFLTEAKVYQRRATQVRPSKDDPL